MARSYQLATYPGSVSTLAGPTVSGGSSITVKNHHASEVVYLGGDENQLPTALGGSPLTSGTGFRLGAGETLQVQLTAGEVLYGISGNATVTNTVTVFSTNFRGR